MTNYSQGSGPGRFEYISKLINENDFVLIQEHWLMECQFYLYSKHVNDINAHCVSAMPSNNYITAVLMVAAPSCGKNP